MHIPKDLIQTIQYGYADSQYKEGTYLVKTIDSVMIESVIKGLLDWAKKKNIIENNKFNLDIFLQD